MNIITGIVAACLKGPGRAVISVGLIAVLCLILLIPWPATAQLGIIAMTIAANAVVSLIKNTIGSLLNTAADILGAINNTSQALSDLFQKVVDPVSLINQVIGLVKQIETTFSSLVASVHNIRISSATLPNPISLESILRNGIIADFGQFDQAFHQVYQNLPPETAMDPGDLQRVDMSDAIAMDVLKQLKGADQVTEQTLQASNFVEHEAGEQVPGSASYVSGSGFVGELENQAQLQRLLAAELRTEAALLAQANAVRKRQADFAAQFRTNAASSLQ
jgi:hypothetical protein